MSDLFYEEDLEIHKARVKALEQTVVMKRMDDAHKLLTVLMEVPGISRYAIVKAYNFAPSLIYRCVEAEMIRVRVQTINHRSVFRFYISQKGRARLKR